MRDDEEAALPDAPDSVSHHGKEDTEPQAKSSSDAGLRYEASAAATGGQRSAKEGNGSSIVLAGSGDAVVELTKHAAGPAVVRITGNAASEYFAVRTVHSDKVLVRTLEPYDGVRLLDWNGGESTGFRVRATGPWRIDVLPRSAIPTFDDAFQGEGDMVVHFTGTGSLAEITGNDEGRYFYVRGFGTDGTTRRLVDTTSPYAGECQISRGPQVFEVQALGSWTITIK